MAQATKPAQSTKRGPKPQGTAQDEPQGTARDEKKTRDVMIKVDDSWNWNEFQYAGRIFSKSGSRVSADDPILEELKGHPYLKVMYA